MRIQSGFLVALVFILLSLKAEAQADSVTIPADTFFKASFIKEFFFGKLYRDVWAVPVKIPTVRLDTLKGGLEAVELGGGQQTKSLRLKDKQGNLYALRSVQKFPDKALPEELRFFPVTFLAKDQISSSLPYSAIILPPMEEKIGIYHTNPQLYFMGTDPGLGEWREIFEGTMVLFEERPEDFNKPVPTFGMTDKWIETDDLREEREESLRHKYNDRLFLKSRLFDMIVGDWDRHEGQWNWGVYDQGNVTFYEPVPIDRDNAFYNFDGFLPWFFSRNWAIPKFQLYEPHINNVAGFNYNARYVDRYFLNELTLTDWIEIADSLKSGLDNEAIRSSLNYLPDTIHQLIGPFLEERIISRKDEITDVAKEYYLHLAEKVNITGSDEDDLFEVNILDESRVQVLLFEYQGRQRSIDTFYNRTFNSDETKEIRLYGEKGADKFLIKGAESSGIKIRIIGGEGDDSITGTPQNSGRIKNLYLYDFPGSFTIDGLKLRQHITNDTALNEYDFKQYRRDYFGPTGSFGYNKDDGFFLSGGILKKVRGFDVEFISEQSLTATFEFGVNAGRIDYLGIFRKVIADRAGFTVSGRYLAPGYPVNFFGYWNGSTFDKGIHHYRVPLHQAQIQPMLDIPFGKKFIFSLGGELEYTKVYKNNYFNYPSFEREYLHTGIVAAAVFNTLDDQVMPEKGVILEGEARYLYELYYDQPQTELDARAATFFNMKNLVLGLNLGYETKFGATTFFRYPSLGSNDGLRGYRQDRFYGHTVIHQNTDLRIKLAKMAGLLIFNDIGKVYPDPSDKQWHQSYGIGFFIVPENIFSLNGTYAISEEGHYFDLRFGFFF